MIAGTQSKITTNFTTGTEAVPAHNKKTGSQNSLMGRGSEMIEHVADRLGHDQRYALDSGKAERELGWKPQTNFTEGIGETFTHYKNTLL